MRKQSTATSNPAKHVSFVNQLNPANESSTNGSRIMARNSKTRSRVLQVQQLEDRKMFASISQVGNTVTIVGDNNWNDDAVIERVGSQVRVRVSSLPTNGFALTASVKEKLVPTTVNQIIFHGNSGNDSFINNWYNDKVLTKAYGGSGNDYLEGYNGRDEFYGGSGNDILKGYSGNDLLHGDSGNDTLYGGADHDDLFGDGDTDTLYGGSGNDGLYGGAGTDKLYGESGSDRFLVMSGSPEQKDAAAEDAVITFRNGNKTWNESEIEAVDVALRQLHHKTGNDNLLELKNGTSMTFVRNAKGSKSTTLADNDSRGTINAYDSMFARNGLAAQTVIHEIAHNWDTEHNNWNTWLSRSGWTSTRPSTANLPRYTQSTDGAWYFQSVSTPTDPRFVRSYGLTNPREQFATAWESYFAFNHGMTNTLGVTRLVSGQQSHLDSFFASLS
jgi:hypothetical protein